MALATDCNPGSSYTSSMPFCMALAVREMRMTPAEALRAATAGGARALRRDDIGVLRPGARADLLVLDAPSYLHLAYRPGVPLIRTVLHNGVPAMTVIVQPTGVTAADVLAVARHDATGRTRRRHRRGDGHQPGHRRRHRGAPAGRSTASRPDSARWPTPPSPRNAAAELQHALIRSHAAGIGAPMPREVVRAMMLLRVRSLALGLSGVRPVLARGLVDLLNADITPWVPEHGSLGASGDLAPLAHCALVLLGEGWVLGKDGARMSAAEALHAAGLAPLELAAKEGLALINGTDGMLGMLLLAIDDAAHLFTMADVTAALAIEAMLGSERPFLPGAARDPAASRPGGVGGEHPPAAAGLVHHGLAPRRPRARRAGRVLDALRPAGRRRGPRHPGLRASRWPAGSCARWWTTRWCCRTAGSSRPATSTARRSASPPTSSPSPPPRWARSPSAGWTGCSTSPATGTCRRSSPPTPGSTPGLMIAQYTAAGIVAENRRLAAPASVDSLPTSGMQEDHVSMGWAATKKLRTVLDNLTSLLAVELLAAVRGLQLRAPLTPSPAGRAAVAAVESFAGGPARTCSSRR